MDYNKYHIGYDPGSPEGDITVEYRYINDRYIRLPRDIDSVKRSPFYGILFSLSKDGLFRAQARRSGLDLMNIIKPGWWITIMHDRSNAARYKVISVYISPMSGKTISLEGTGLNSLCGLKIYGVSDILEYFPDGPDVKPTIPHVYPEAPFTDLVKNDLFLRESDRFLSNPDRYSNDRAIMGLKTLYKNLKYHDMISNTKIMSKILNMQKRK